MKYNKTYQFCLILISLFLTSCSSISTSNSIIKESLAGRDGVFILIDCSTRKTVSFPSDKANQRMAPCSTFKIANTLIALENGIVKSAGEDFYKWDGKKRSYAPWNKDLSLREAFQVSCVPAFQILARKIGAETMQIWVNKFNYGTMDISSGIDMFWLPAKDRATIKISPFEQAEFLRRLVLGKLPVSQSSVNVLKEIMKIEETPNGILYGKTGSGTNDKGVFNLGWFVGYVECKKTTYTFACMVQGEQIMSKHARAIVEDILHKEGIL